MGRSTTGYDEMTVDELRDRAKERGIGGIWDMKKEQLIEALEDGGETRGKGNGDTRGRPADAPSQKQIASIEEHEDYPGQTLWTRNHDVIRAWAESRQATPATVGEGEVRVLRFDFPGYGGDTLRHISWDEWFTPFDERELRFMYQEHMRDGRDSNFFRLENPDREDG